MGPASLQAGGDLGVMRFAAEAYRQFGQALGGHAVHGALLALCIGIEPQPKIGPGVLGDHWSGAGQHRGHGAHHMLVLLPKGDGHGPRVGQQSTGAYRSAYRSAYRRAAYPQGSTRLAGTYRQHRQSFGSAMVSTGQQIARRGARAHGPTCGLLPLPRPYRCRSRGRGRTLTLCPCLSMQPGACLRSVLRQG